MDLSPPRQPFQVAALYRFCRLAEPEALRAPLLSFCREQGIRGTILLAREGVNGTVAGNGEAIAALLAYLSAFPEFHDLEVKFSRAETMPFHRMKVWLKREIVSMGVDGIDPVTNAGTYIEPAGWNALIADPQTIVVDTRNDYEVAVGSFVGAIDPKTKSFREFPEWAAAHRTELEKRKVAMFCTGGIRCEKATAYMRSLGLDEVYHLKGGILRYLEEVPAEESLWQGECFVFDERVAVTSGLERGQAELCRACRRPLTAEDRHAPHFVAGVSCAYCHDQRTDADRARYAERQRQVELAERRGDAHIGPAPAAPS